MSTQNKAPSVREAAISARERMTQSEKRKMERAAEKRGTRYGDKIWVEVTQQPEKTRSGQYVGRATFHWQKGPEKDKKRSQMINVGSEPGTKLSIKSRKLQVKPKNGEAYFYGEKEEEKGGEEGKKGAEDEFLKLAPPPTDVDGDGVQESARVGVPARAVPAPPKLPRLPNLTDDEKAIEARAIEIFEKDPDGVANQYMKMVEASGNAKFVTDDAKLLFPDYTPKGKTPEEVAANRARHNILLHQVANAIAKRAFVKKLDELAKLADDDPRKSVLVTSGGCGAGKGFALKKGPSEVQDKVSAMGAVWDAAGEQNATENPWIVEECRKRGIKATFVFVDSDPSKTWDGPWGVVKRAATPPPDGEGRMVDARLFADSYALGAKNMKAFMDKEKDAKDVDFIVLNNRGAPPPKLEKEIGKEALSLNADALYKDALKAVEEGGAAPTEAIKYGATIGKRIWQDNGGKAASAAVNLSATLSRLSAEREQSKLQKEYQEFFNKKLDEYDADSPDDLDEETRKKFFNEIELEWEEGKGPTKASISAAEGEEEEDPETKALAKNLQDNLAANLAAPEAYFQAKWAAEQKMLDHQLVSNEDGSLAIPASESPAEGGEEPSAEEEKPTVAARIDAVAELLSRVKVSSMTLLAVEEAAELLNAARMTTTQKKAMERAAKKRGDKYGDKIWVEVTQQPEKTRSGQYVGRATFHWQKGPDKDKKRSQMINVGSEPGTKLSVRSRKLQVKPKGGEPYFYGEKSEAPKGGEKGDEPKKPAINEGVAKSYLESVKKNPETADQNLLDSLGKKLKDGGSAELKKLHEEVMSAELKKLHEEVMKQVSNPSGISEEDMAKSAPVKSLEKMIEQGDMAAAGRHGSP